MGNKDQKIADLERDIELYEETIGALRGTLDLANDHLRLERENGSNLKKELEVCVGSKNKLWSKYVARIKELEEAQSMSNQFKENHRCALIKLDSAQEDMGELQAAFDVKTKENYYLRSEIERLEEINRGLNKKNQGLNVEVKHLESQAQMSEVKNLTMNVSRLSPKPPGTRTVIQDTSVYVKDIRNFLYLLTAAAVLFTFITHLRCK